MAAGHARANRQYKDTVFRDLFGAEERKENALSLYNALNGTSYTDPNELKLTTLDDVLYMGLRNDVSLLVGNNLSLWEHQSTRNPNMPIRGLKYFARLYAAHEEKHGLNEYSQTLLRLPTPRFVVLYVGQVQEPALKFLKLSDSYEGKGDVEVIATTINVMAEENAGLLADCEPLAGYVHLVRLVRRYQECGLAFDEAVDCAVQQCIDEGVLADYLLQRRSSVIDMFMDEYDEAKISALFKEEGRQEGRKEGRKEGRVAAFVELVREGLLQEEEAAQRAGVSRKEMHRLALEGL